METIREISAMQAYIAAQRVAHKRIGFVPTMGALHEGHLSLVLRAKSECDIVVVSIFVNPTQFNNPDDFAKYPITPEADSQMLADTGCDVIFMPAGTEVYAADYVAPDFNLGIYDRIMEGAFRPGHFKGVVQVVYRLFDLVKPDKAYFGLKDYQQVAVIRNMTLHFNLPIDIVACPTVREKDGLALSSRNLRLNDEQRNDALFIYHSLMRAKSLQANLSPDELKQLMKEEYSHSPLELEYFEIIHPESFEILHDSWTIGAVACVVAYIGGVRLIDNMVIAD